MKLHVCVGTWALLLALGCGKPAQAPVKREPPHAEPPKARVSKRAGNREGSVLIVEYHKVAKKEARWDRSISRFQSDLKRFYEMGFRPVTLGAYLANRMDLAPGASPIVFTFDDSHPSQFNLREDGSLDPECALGIWEAFAKEHPDFPIRASFYVLPDSGPWGQAKLADRKFEMLRAWGCEVGSHTLSHRKLSSLSKAEVVRELEESKNYVQSKQFVCDSIALPYGISPKDRSLLKRYYKAALLVGANPAPSPISKDLDPLRLPRIQSIEGDFGITYWLDRIEQGKTSVYVEP